TFRVIHQSQEFGLVLRRVQGIDWGGLMWYWLPLLSYAMAIFYVSSLSVPEKEFAFFLDAVNALIPAEGDIFFVINDKIYHITEYAILATLAYRAFRYSMPEKAEVFIGLLTVVAVVLFGCTDEIHQWFTPLRYSDGWDLMADALGGIIGVSLWQVALSIPVIRLFEERIPLKLQVALGIHVLKL
ncbi:MAG: VanZ family protein, partial [Nitrospirota bacterium]|nr:VanZ family protein [Nitrospirota bacterium]